MIFPLRLIGIFIIAASLLTGCGFHLRGNFTLPDSMSSLYIQVPTHLANELMVLLEGNGIAIAPDRDVANAILVVEQESFDKRTLSVDSKSGKEREHELAYTISYRVLATDGRELLPKRTINLVRDYVFDESAVLGTTQEEGVLYKEMRQDAAHQILRHLAAWSP
uniref:LPS-assembly lipoprotein LptE n=1 Tax=Candidatus Kentrum sp. LFY TaxID=2126342 RepID=A0A450UJD8_9GAMM|nr:MAG: LPS-assembly lipoprotein [Candidatus Kentron sp. LFY]VFJ92633.1 MAG: LPS-assembly lipoprotein [Candidatus Kentron sp. LFY]